MKTTKKHIIDLLKQTKTATLAYYGLVNPEDVTAKRKAIIDDIQKQVDVYNANNTNKVTVIIDNNTVKAGNTFLLLPPFPRTGNVTVRSADYIIDKVFCSQADILPDTFAETDNTYAFQTKNQSTILWCKTA